MFDLDGATSGSTFITNNTTYRVLADKTVSWGVIFTSTDDFVGGSTRCETTTLTVDNG